MQYKLFEPKDNAEGQLDSNIGASTLTIPLETGDGAAFPAIYTGATTSGGTSTLMNKTGISGSGIAIGDFIENITDGSHAFVLSIAADSLTTTSLAGGSDNTWQNADTYAVNRFIITLNKRDANGDITASEKVLIDSRSSDILTVNASGRGYDGSVAQAFDASDYVNIFVTALHIGEQHKAFAEMAEMLDLRYTKTAIDALIAGRNWKDAVIVATTVAGTLASSFENGDTIDGVVLVTGDRILIKDQASAIENGIYTVNASGAPTRATDFDTTAEVYGSAVSVKKGSSNADSIWLCTSDNPTVGVDNIAFAQIGLVLSKASEAEAQAGTNDTKYMTPAKTWDAIAAAGEIQEGTLGDAINSGDISGYTNLVYFKVSDSKWYKVTSTYSDWADEELGLVLETGSVNDTVKILRRGLYPFVTTAVNPSFTNSGTGTDNLVGQAAANSMVCELLDNSSGAECVVSGGQISAKQTGTPAGAMLIYLVLGGMESGTNGTTESYPACFKDTSGNVVRGAIIASATIAQANFSGVYQNLSYSYGANIKIPAGMKVYRVIAKTGAVSGANYYQVQSSAALALYNETTQTWSGTAINGNSTETVVSTDPIGYAVKGFTGSNGSFGLTPSERWNRSVGRIRSLTTMYFDPRFKHSVRKFANFKLNKTAASGFSFVNCGFCPNQVKAKVTRYIDATTDQFVILEGILKSGMNYTQIPSSGSRSVSQDMVLVSMDTAPNTTAGNTPQSFSMAITGIASTSGYGVRDDYATPITYAAFGANVLAATPRDQNKIRLARLENGFYLFADFPNGTANVDGGVSGFTEVYNEFVFDVI